MTFYAGFDCSAFPGLVAMQWLKSNTNLSWTGFYLGPAPSHRDTGWMFHRGDLLNQGWGLAPIYVGQESQGPGSHVVTGVQGASDGLAATQLMTRAGFSPGSSVYLDLEAPDPERDYLIQWTEVVREQGFTPRVYCSHLITSVIEQLTPGIGLWVYRVGTVSRHRVPGKTFSTDNPSGSGYDPAIMWQHDQNAVIDCDETQLQVDLSCSTVSDPSTPQL